MKNPRAATVLISLLVAMPALAGGPPALAAGKTAPTATVAPGTVWPEAEPCVTGTGVHDFTVSGGGFRPGELLRVTVGEVAYDETRADADGAYTVGYQVRPQPAGVYRVEVAGDRGGWAVGRIKLGYAACRSTSDGRLRVTGAGFGGTDAIAVRLDGEATAAITATSTEEGAFDLRTACPPGPHTLEVADSHENVLRFAEFTC
jgi:hypothetical protein